MSARPATKKWLKLPKISTLLVFISIALMLVMVEAWPQFPDPDSFYHAKMAVSIRDRGFIHAFPWLQFTGIRDSYVNAHILYHIVLIPFVTLFNPLVGMKISAVIFALVSFAAIYLFLKRLKAPHPEFLTFAAALSPGFFQRVAMPRAPALSIALLLLITWLMIKNKRLPVFLVGAVFVWFYHGWPVTVLSLLAVLAAETLAAGLVDSTPWTKAVKETAKNRWQISLSLLAGLLAGFVVNPYFPENAAYSLLQIVQIGMVNYQTVIPVGSEWSMLSIGGFLARNATAAVLFALSIALLFPAVAWKKFKISHERLSAILTCFFLACGYFVLTLKSVRFIEYSVPFMILSAGAFFSISSAFIKDELIPAGKKIFSGKIFPRAAAAIFSAFLLCQLITTYVFVIPPRNMFAASRYQETTDWIRQNVPRGETVFHNIWDYSLILFYLDDTHYYLIGLDPTLMYDEDPEAYELWTSISKGEKDDLAPIVKTFNSKTVIVDSRDSHADDFIAKLNASELFEEVPQGSEEVSLFHCTKLCDEL